MKHDMQSAYAHSEVPGVGCVCAAADAGVSLCAVWCGLCVSSSS
jgi:hypothetical protein